MDTQTPTTCQICGRAIKAKKGHIAHHGYKRPGGGWQTASCSGATHLPYEVSCDRIPGAIASCQGFIDGQRAILRDHLTTPPDTLEFTKHHAKTPTIVQRPAGFNAATAYSGIPYTYENEFSRKQHHTETMIKLAGYDLEFLTKRLADWKAPTVSVKSMPAVIEAVAPVSAAVPVTVEVAAPVKALKAEDITLDHGDMYFLARVALHNGVTSANRINPVLKQQGLLVAAGDAFALTDLGRGAVIWNLWSEVERLKNENTRLKTQIAQGK